ncbi:hypothetical protein EGW08_012096, partial [Elysia chlorotica]
TAQPREGALLDRNQSNSKRKFRRKRRKKDALRGDNLSSSNRETANRLIDASTSTSSLDEDYYASLTEKYENRLKEDARSDDSKTSNPSTASFSKASETSSTKRKKARKKKRGFWSRLCKSSPDEGRLLKAVLWFPIGCIIAVILYFAIIRKLNMKEKTKAVIGAAIGAFLSLSFAFSVQIRCTLSLVMPSFMGKAGRSYITAFAIIYLIEGPITNIIGNSKEIVRALTCNSALIANHTKTKWKLRLHPIEGAVGDLTKDNFQLNRVARSIKRAFAPLKREINKNLIEEESMEARIKQVDKIKKKEGGPKDDTLKKINEAHKYDNEDPDAGKEVEKQWKKKVQLRCQDIFSKGVVRCREKMSKLYSKCRGSIKIIGGLLCLPLKIKLFCNIIKILPGALGLGCSGIEEVVPVGVGETFISAKAVVDGMDEGMNVKMQYKLVGDAEAVDYSPLEEVRAATMHEVDERSAFINFIFSMISGVLTFTFLLVFKSAFTYNTKYLTELQFDNVYVTRYFKHIDARRRAQGKKTLFPLKKFEKEEIVDPMKIRLSKEEKGQIKKGTGRLILRVIIAAIICYMDSLLYQVMDIIARNSRVTYHQEGEHIIDIKVYGTGFMSALVRNFLVRFNTNTTLDEVSTNHHCLPNPEETSGLIIGFIFGTYILVWVFMYFESFGLRLRHVIAGFFYRKREKTRVLHLYNEMFRRRIGYLSHLRKVVRKSLKKRTYKRDTSLFVSLQRQYPRCFSWLRLCKSPKEKCIICGDPQDEDFYLCETKGCGTAYCRECWRDVKHKCYACLKGEESDIEDDEAEFDTDSSDLSCSE